MSLQGLPDFQRPIEGEGFAIYYPFEAAGQHCLLPGELEVATTDRGRPDFLLELVRGESPDQLPLPYGVLSLRVRPRYPLEDALLRLRQESPRSSLGFPVFTRGFLRLHSLGPEEVPEDLLAPVELGFSGLGIARLVLKVPEASAGILRRALEEEALAFLASAEVEIEGVSPRLPIRVTVRAAELLSELAALAEDETGVVERARLVEYFRRDIADLPLDAHGTVASDWRHDFAEAATDRVRLQWGEFVPSPRSDGRPSLRVATSDPHHGSARQDWDLAVAARVPRPIALTLDPLAAARELVAAEGLESLVRETIVPALNTGGHEVTVTANLPQPRPGILVAGLTLSADGHPPHRLHPIERSVEIQAPEDSASVSLQLSALEPLAFRAKTYLVARIGGRIDRFEGPSLEFESDRVDLSPSAFPVRFYPVEASAGLLRLATLHGVCHALSVRGASRVEFELTTAEPRTTLLLPTDTEPVRIEIEAREIDGSGVAGLDLPAATDLSLDLHSFAEYGSHTVLLSWEFAPDSPPVAAVDLLPHRLPETPENLTVLHFSPDRPQREWSYLATSPFAAGFLLREHAAPGEPLQPWSEPYSPFAGVVLGSAGVSRAQR